MTTLLFLLFLNRFMKNFGAGFVWKILSRKWIRNLQKTWGISLYIRTYICPPSYLIPRAFSPLGLKSNKLAQIHVRKPIFWTKDHGFGLIDLDSGFWYPNSGFEHPHLDLTNPDLCPSDPDSGIESQILDPGTQILAPETLILVATKTQILDSWD